MFKALGFILAGKDASRVYKEETNKEKPVWLSRRLIGAIITAIGAGLAWKFGVDTATVTQFAEKADSVASGLNQVYDIAMNNKSALVAVYGSILSFLGFSQQIIQKIKGGNA